MRKLYEGFKIDDSPLPLMDAGIELTMEDLDSEESGRDESGVMHRIVLREKVKTWTIHYSVLQLQEYRYILSLFRGKPTFTVTMLDEYGVLRQYQAYCSKLSATHHDRKRGIYKNMSIKIIEC